MTLYFAYGSNMDATQISTRCQNAEFRAIGYLPDYELWFPRRSRARNCGVSSIRPALGSETWGVIFRLTDADVAALDKSEGFVQGRDPRLNAYNRVDIQVMMGGAIVTAATYIAEEQTNPPLPSTSYLSLLQSGAKKFELPDAYQVLLGKIVGEGP